jgi:hypothetical protein
MRRGLIEIQQWLPISWRIDPDLNAKLTLVELLQGYPSTTASSPIDQDFFMSTALSTDDFDQTVCTQEQLAIEGISGFYCYTRRQNVGLVVRGSTATNVRSNHS